MFQNKLSLSELSLQMWERLGFQKMDASVLSRVLKGERLFTPSQLQAFCDVLTLPIQEKEFLFHCLAQDYFKRDNIIISSQMSSQDELVDVLKKLARQGADLFYEGKSQEVIRQSDLIDTIFERIAIDTLSQTARNDLFEQYGYYIFLRERSIAGTYDPQTAARSLMQTANFLENISIQYDLQNLNAYAHILIADIWYMRGSNRMYPKSNEAFAVAMKHAHAAFTSLSPTHTEKLASLRLMAASSCYINDAETVRFAETMAKKLLPLQPEANATNALHLSKILTKGKVMIGDGKPFAIEEKVWSTFKDFPGNDGIYYQLSDIKTRIETFSLFKLQDKTILVPLIEKGLTLVNQGNYPRHKKFLQTYMLKFS